MSAKIHDTPKRPGGENRGSSTDRRRRKHWMLSVEAGFGGDGTKVPCTHCRAVLDFSTVEADRIIPGSLGGRYVRANIQPACGSCNKSRCDNVNWRYGA
jgi:5-methylcytosine-specific restriction endonuclease McrA